MTSCAKIFRTISQAPLFHWEYLFNEYLWMYYFYSCHQGKLFFSHKCNTWNSFYTWVANDPIFAAEESECNAMVEVEEGGGWGVNPDVEDDEVTPAELTYTE